MGDMAIDYGAGLVVNLPLCEECATTLQNHPELALDLQPVDVLDLEQQEALGNT